MLQPVSAYSVKAPSKRLTTRTRVCLCYTAAGDTPDWSQGTKLVLTPKQIARRLPYLDEIDAYIMVTPGDRQLDTERALDAIERLARGDRKAIAVPEVCKMPRLTFTQNDAWKTFPLWDEGEIC